MWSRRRRGRKEFVRRIWQLFWGSFYHIIRNSTISKGAQKISIQSNDLQYDREDEKEFVWRFWRPFLRVYSYFFRVLSVMNFLNTCVFFNVGLFYHIIKNSTIGIWAQKSQYHQMMKKDVFDNIFTCLLIFFQFLAMIIFLNTCIFSLQLWAIIILHRKRS